jgi:hypothetical protein
MAPLALQDDLYLHAHDESGRMVSHRSVVEIGLTGAALVQLWLAGRITLVDGVVMVRSTQPTGEPMCDRIMEAILSLSHSHAPRTWVGWLNEGAYERVRDRLVELGVLEQVTSRRLGLVARTRYDVADQQAVIRSHGRTRYAVLGFERPDIATAALCALIGVLRLEGGLYVNLSPGEVLNRLSAIGGTVPPEVREIVTAVDQTAAAASVSMYR